MKVIFIRLALWIARLQLGVTPRWIGWLRHTSLRARCERSIACRPYLRSCGNKAFDWTQKFWKQFIRQERKRQRKRLRNTIFGKSVVKRLSNVSLFGDRI